MMQNIIHMLAASDSGMSHNTVVVKYWLMTFLPVDLVVSDEANFRSGWNTRTPFGFM
jgi:hypothetical protein